MNNVLLINRIIPTIDDDRICNITFVIADMHLQEVHDKIIKVIDLQNIWIRILLFSISKRILFHCKLHCKKLTLLNQL